MNSENGKPDAEKAADLARDFIADNPWAKWDDVFANVPHHYSTPESFQKCMRKLGVFIRPRGRKPKTIDVVNSGCCIGYVEIPRSVPVHSIRAVPCTSSVGVRAPTQRFRLIVLATDIVSQEEADACRMEEKRERHV